MRFHVIGHFRERIYLVSFPLRIKMAQTVPPSSLVEGALVMQVCLSLIVGAGASWVSSSERWAYHFQRNLPSPARFPWIAFLFALVPIGILVFSDAFAGVGRPLFGALSLSLIRWQTALLMDFLIDILCVWLLIRQSGGSYRSPFTPVYFILPALAFFLRESGQHVALYVALIAIFFTLGLREEAGERRSADRPVAAYWVVSVACLLLSGFIGYLARPG